MGTLFKSKTETKNDEQISQNRQVFQYPAVDIAETENGFVLDIELPGVKKEDISLDLNSDVLSIAASRTKGDVDYQYERQFRVGSKVNTDSISAKFEQGLLSVELSKKDSEKPRAIQIQS